MDLVLHRKSHRVDGVFGEMTNERGDFIAVTLERAYPPDFSPKILAGIYICKRYNSPKHGYEVFVLTGENADGHFYEIHIGNYNEDSDGCILVALGNGFKGDQKGRMITASKAAFDKIMQLQDGLDSFTLTVIDPD